MIYKIKIKIKTKISPSPFHTDTDLDTRAASVFEPSKGENQSRLAADERDEISLPFTPTTSDLPHLLLTQSESSRAPASQLWLI